MSKALVWTIAGLLLPVLAGPTALVAVGPPHRGPDGPLPEGAVAPRLGTFERHRVAPLVRFALHSRDTLISRDGEKAYLWDTTIWKRKEALTIPGKPSWHYAHHFAGSIDAEVAWERGVYVAASDKRLELRDLKTGTFLRRLEGGGPADESVFSASGDRMVASADKGFMFFDVGTGKKLSQVPQAGAVLLGFRPVAKLSPQGRYFAHNNQGEVHLHDVRSGKRLGTLAPKFQVDPRRRSGTTLGFRFSDDETVVLGEVHEALGFENGFSGERISVTLWETATGKVIQDLAVFPTASVFFRRALSQSFIGPIALSHDRRHVALATRESNTVEIWETASGTKRGELVGHAGAIADLAFSPDDRHLVSSSEDTTLLVWDMARPLHAGKFRDRLGSRGLADHWQALSQTDAAKADSAIWSLVAAPRDAVPFLKKHLRPIAHPDAGRVRQLLADLASATLKTRAEAATGLEALADAVLPELQRAAGRKNDLELQHRLELLLHKAEEAARPFGTSDRLRRWRALEVLERTAGTDAVQLLRELAGGAPGARATVDARAALRRLAVR